MLIKMLSTRMGSERGFGVKQYKEGEYYYMADSLASSFVRLGYAKFVLGSGGAPKFPLRESPCHGVKMATKEYDFMNHLLAKVRHFMSEFFDKIEAAIATIHAADPSADISALKAELLADIKAATDANSDVLAKQAALIAELQTAVSDVVSHLQAGNASAALGVSQAATSSPAAQPAA